MNIRLDDKRLEGIAEVRDESDRTGLRIVIEMKKDVDGRWILQYLFKNTDLQVTYNFNMIAIHNRRPTMMTLAINVRCLYRSSKRSRDKTISNLT